MYPPRKTPRGDWTSVQALKLVLTDIPSRGAYLTGVDIKPGDGPIPMLVLVAAAWPRLTTALQHFWLIERDESHPARPQYLIAVPRDGPKWSPPGEIDLALRFARPPDAAAIAHDVDPTRQHRVEEHKWE